MVSGNARIQFCLKICIQKTQCFSRSVSALSSILLEYLEPVAKAEQCAQYVDDTGIAANNATDLNRNIQAVFKCIRQAGSKLTIEKCFLESDRFTRRNLTKSSKNP